MGRRDGLTSDKPTVLKDKPLKPSPDIKTQSDIRGTRPTGVILDQMRRLAEPTVNDLDRKKPK